MLRADETAVNPSPHSLLRMDQRRGPKGEMFRGLAFASEAEAHRWVDRTDDATRAELVAGGFRIQPTSEALVIWLAARSSCYRDLGTAPAALVAAELAGLAAELRTEGGAR